MQTGKRLLIIGGSLTAIAALLHVAIIIGGPGWYRFFGAGERMARLAARGSIYPAMVTAFIAAVLVVWALYAFSGAGVIRRLPLLRLALTSIAAVYLARGILGVAVVLFIDDVYTNQLKAKMTFMVVSSLICVVLGLCYALGAARLWRKSPDNSAQNAYPACSGRIWPASSFYHRRRCQAMDEEQSRALIARVDAVLWEVWDPIGVNHAPEARDEYASYAPHIAHLLRSGASDAEIERHLATIILENMAMSWVNPDGARRTLAALREIPIES